MSAQRILASLCGLAMAAACRNHPAPAPVAQTSRDSSCARSDSGVALGQDVSRGPRYRVDSSGRVETLPPVPTAPPDSTRGGCPAVSDTSAEAKQ